MWDRVIASLLMFSWRIPGESVTEIIGHKTDTGVMSEFMHLFSPLMLNHNMEEGLWKFMSTFRLAGVES